jgi:hypothetical protein
MNNRREFITLLGGWSLPHLLLPYRVRCWIVAGYPVI